MLRTACSTCVNPDVARPQCGNPVVVRLPQIGYPCFRDHAPVTDHHQTPKSVLCTQAGDLRLERVGIGHIAREHLDGHRTAAAVRDQAVGELLFPAFLVPAVAKLREGAVRAFEIGGRQVVQHQRAVGQTGLDARLLRQQGIHRIVECVDRQRVRNGQQGGQGRLLPVRGGEPLGGGFDQAGDDHAQHERTPGCVSADEGVESDLAQDRENGPDGDGSGREWATPKVRRPRAA